MERQTQSKAFDPVCGMEISPSPHELAFKYNGRLYYFCAECCLTAFQKNPDKYARPKGFVGRFLGRMVRANVKAFGRSGPPCH
jgi:Cu+-exporting ATPase